MNEHDQRTTRREVLRLGVAGLGAAAIGPTLLSACGGSSGGTTSTQATTTTAPSIASASLLAAARKEGKLNLVGITDADGSPYRYIVEGFHKYSGIAPNLQLTTATSAMEMKAIADGVGKPTQPDSLNLGVSFALDAVKAGQLAVYRPTRWDDVPSTAKDVGGRWFSACYGLISIATNTKNVPEAPKSFADLKNLPARGWLAITGDPRTNQQNALSSSIAFNSVWAASLANGGSLDDIEPGIAFFAELKQRGIFDPTRLGFYGSAANGNSPITLMVHYDAQRAQKMVTDHAQVDLNIEIPDDGVFPTYYAQAAVNDSPNPSAASLWLEYLLSDEGALAFMRAGAISTRFPIMHQHGVIPKDLLAKLPDVKLLEKVEIPSPNQVIKAQDVVNARWGPEVLGE